MPDEIDATVQHARHYLESGTSDAKDVLAWRKQLRRQGHPALARELARTLAERFIGGKSLRVDDVDQLWKACKTDEAFSYARRVLKRRLSSAPNVLPAGPNYEPPTLPRACRTGSAVRFLSRAT